MFFAYLTEGKRKHLEKMYQERSEKDIDIKKWNKELLPKVFLLLPSISFVLTFLKINTDKSVIDLLGFIAVSGLFVSDGIFLNYLLSKGK